MGDLSLKITRDQARVTGSTAFVSLIVTGTSVWVLFERHSFRNEKLAERWVVLVQRL